MSIWTALGRSGSRTSHSPLAFKEWVDFFQFNGLNYPAGLNQTLNQGEEKIGEDFAGHVEGIYKTNGIVFACMLARLALFSEARFQFRRRVLGRPGELYGTRALTLLEEPWANGTTGDLLTRMIQTVDLAGNFYALRTRKPGHPERLVPLRPDWVTIIRGDKKDNPHSVDAELLGYVYQPGGPGSGENPDFYLPNSVVHWAPIPDPLANYRGMSWLTPVLREIMGDQAATTHKLNYFKNGATPNLVITMNNKATPEEFAKWIDMFEEQHEGVANAYKTLYFGAGADAKVIGSDLKAIDFKSTQGAGETRIAAAAGVPPIIVGLSEGLAAATYSNYGQARRRYADGTMRPLWRSAAGALAPAVKVPNDAELWYDDRDISFLQEDRKDAAEIQSTAATTVKTLVDAGFTPESVIAAVEAEDMTRLVHTGLFSVQLQPAGAENPGAKSNGSGEPDPLQLNP